MGKQTVFLSHSSKDGAMLRRLKTRLEEKTHRTIKFFLSSDGQSIPFGRNWVSEIEGALNASTLLFCFITPHSIKSNWLHFEGGFAYARGAKVVPVGVSGVNLEMIAPPLQLLQGFNAHDHGGLNNLIQTINDELDTSHPLTFTEEDFREIMGLEEAATAEIALGDILDSLEFEMQMANPIEQVLDVLRLHGFEPEQRADKIENCQHFTCPGLLVSCSDQFLTTKGNELFQISAAQFKIEPMQFADYAPVFDSLRTKQAEEQTKLNCRFSEGWKWLAPKHRLLAKFLGSNLQWNGSKGASFQGHSFSIPDDDHRDWGAKLKRHISINVCTSFAELPLTHLLNLLIQAGAVLPVGVGE